MKIIYNTHSIQSKFIPTWFENTIGIDDISEVMNYVNDSEKTYVFIGFIYKEGLFDYFVGKNIYFITNVGALPKQFNTVGDKNKHWSFLHQLVHLGVMPYSLPIMNLYTDHDNYFNFLSSNEQLQNFLLDSNYKKVDELINKCYYNKVGENNIYLLYENDAKLKLPIAHRALEEKQGIFIIVSQTRSNNDILTIFAKGIDMDKLSQVFEVDTPIDSNIITLFIPSHINVLGNQLTKFLEEK